MLNDCLKVIDWLKWLRTRIASAKEGRYEMEVGGGSPNSQFKLDVVLIDSQSGVGSHENRI